MATVRNPTWNRDELVLALELYLRTNGNPIGKDFDALDQLSHLLNKMHRLNGVTGSATLRNRNGVYLKVMNFRASDPEYVSQGKVGMTRGNALESVLWQEYQGRHGDLAADAVAIRHAVESADEKELGRLPVVPPYEGEEGGVIIGLHRRYERDRRLIREKRKAAKAAGNFSCEVCGFDFEAAYGPIGTEYIEFHHTKPVHTLKRGTKSQLSDLALLCANCHRMAHRRRMPLNLDELKAAMQAAIAI